MSFSRERVFHLVSLILEELEKGGVIISEPERLRGRFTRVFSEELRVLETIDQEARSKIEKMSKPVAEGSGEWKALYEKFFDEEWKRRLKL